MGDEAAHRGELIAVPGDAGSWTCLVSALRPDVVLVHGAAADGLIRAHNTLARIPGHVVRAVCEAPYGAHPYGFNTGAINST
jgi:hypothetical protein